MIQEWSDYPETVVAYDDENLHPDWTCATVEACPERLLSDDYEDYVGPEDTHVLAHGRDTIGVNLAALARAIRSGEESTSVGSRAVYEPDAFVRSEDRTQDVYLNGGGEDTIVEAVYR